MKKYMLNLKENEEMMIDVDDQMESIMVGFRKAVKGLNEKDLEIFANWVKVYKLLNYDIIPDLEVEKVFKLNDVVAAVIVKFRGVREFDLLSFNHKEMTVTCLNTKDGKHRNYITRRLLVPTTVEEALMYAKRDIDELGEKLLVSTFEQIKKHAKKLDVTTTILNKPVVKQKEVKTEVKTKQEEVKTEVETKQEEVKTEVETKQEEVKTEQRKLRRIAKIRQLVKTKQEEDKEEKIEVKEVKAQEPEIKEDNKTKTQKMNAIAKSKEPEVKEEVKIRTEAEIIEDCIRNGKPIDYKELRKAAKIKQQELRNKKENKLFW